MLRRCVALFGLVAALALAGCASEDWETRYQEVHGELLDTVAERDGIRQDLDDAFVELESLRAQAAQREAELAAQRAQTSEAVRRAQELATKMDSMAKTPAPAPRVEAGTAAESEAARLRGMGLDSHATPDGNVEIRLSSDITFAAGQATLTKKGQDVLRRVAPQLTSQFAPYQIRVEGHTDSDPIRKSKWTDNRELGGARANAVVRFLESDMGITPGRIEATSKGEHEPLVPNTSDANKAKNRRVAIVVVMPRKTIEAEAMGR